MKMLREWTSPRRIIPLVTLLGAGLSVVLSRANVLQLSLAEEILVALLGLLAGDALFEWINVLEKIEGELRRISRRQPLRMQTDLPSIQDQAQGASTIDILGVSGLSVLLRAQGFLRQRIQRGCHVSVLLLNPKSPALDTWSMLQQSRTAPLHDITSALEIAKKLVAFDEAAETESRVRRGSCSIRLSEVFLPYSMFAVDAKTIDGTSVVEFHSYKGAYSDRPHVFLSAREDRHWFEYYLGRFESAWDDASTLSDAAGSGSG